MPRFQTRRVEIEAFRASDNLPDDLWQEIKSRGEINEEDMTVTYDHPRDGRMVIHHQDYLTWNPVDRILEVIPADVFRRVYEPVTERTQERPRNLQEVNPYDVTDFWRIIGDPNR